MTNAPANSGAFHYADYTLNRNDDAGMIFLSCDGMPEMFVAVTSESDIRSAIDISLKQALSEGVSRVQVFTNGKICGPQIDTVVKITE